MRTLIALSLCTLLLHAQNTVYPANMPSTRLAAALDNQSLRVFVTDLGVVQNPGLPIYQDPGDPLGGPGPTYLFIEQEAIRVVTVNVREGYVQVQRGVQGTHQIKHNLGMIVFSAPGHFYAFQDPRRGPCYPNTIVALPWVNMNTGAIWNCFNNGWRLGIDWDEANFTWDSQQNTWNTILRIS